LIRNSTSLRASQGHRLGVRSLRTVLGTQEHSLLVTSRLTQASHLSTRLCLSPEILPFWGVLLIRLHRAIDSCIL
jgi:hypothetical protein